MSAFTCELTNIARPASWANVNPAFFPFLPLLTLTAGRFRNSDIGSDVVFENGQVVTIQFLCDILGNVTTNSSRVYALGHWASIGFLGIAQQSAAIGAHAIMTCTKAGNVACEIGRAHV